MTQETHQDWHPPESPEHLQRAVRRVRERNGMSTRETREQFRDRLRSTAYGAAMAANTWTQSEYEAAGMAVYALALRDVRQAVAGGVETFVTVDDVDAFAAERGIELGEAGDE